MALLIRKKGLKRVLFARQYMKLVSHLFIIGHTVMNLFFVLGTALRFLIKVKKLNEAKSRSGSEGK
jgi:hypothetical protein